MGDLKKMIKKLLLILVPAVTLLLGGSLQIYPHAEASVPPAQNATRTSQLRAQVQSGVDELRKWPQFSP
jgi:hypothetical protein